MLCDIERPVALLGRRKEDACSRPPPPVLLPARGVGSGVEDDESEKSDDPAGDDMPLSLLCHTLCIALFQNIERGILAHLV